MGELHRNKEIEYKNREVNIVGGVILNILHSYEGKGKDLAYIKTPNGKATWIFVDTLEEIDF